MPDISMCANTTCQSRRYCYRHHESGTKPSGRGQSYIAFEPMSGEEMCVAFVPSVAVKTRNAAEAALTTERRAKEEAEREREDARVERGNIAEDYRELETKLRNTFADAQSMKRRAESAETRSAELARALEELIIAADSLAITANLSQADREIDRARAVLRKATK